MRAHSLATAVIGLALTWGLSGCGWKIPDAEDAVADQAMSELSGSGGRSTDGVMLASTKDLKTENLELRLQVGDRFPLIKTVEQRLKQLSATGGPVVESSSQLTMTLAIQVEEIRDEVKRLGVRYQRVRYEHDIAGEQVRYDSAIPEMSIPQPAQVFHGLVDNGFSFLLGADNRIVKVIEFDAFLKRCVRHVPPDQQRELLTRLVASQEDEGIANFIDDSIGLLPYNIDSRNAGGSVKVGDTWRKNRQIVRPIPLNIDTVYKLESLNPRYANVELFGQIMPAQIEHVGNTAAQQAGLTEKMSLRSGHCFGTCTIDRESGLPIQSRVVRQMDMTLELPTGARFDQRKEITTTIRAFPQQASAATARNGDAPSTRPEMWSSPSDANGPGSTSANRPRPNRQDTNVVPAGFQQ